MTQQQLDKIKQVQLEIMDEIHRVCSENSVEYFMICGTMLGAVRHQGFIPWDVDIDIAMPRKHYERFKEVCLEHLDDKYKYCDHTYTKWYHQPHALICKKNTNVYTKYDSLNPVNKNYGIYIDVFPLDNVPQEFKKQQKQMKKLKRIRRFKEFRIPYSYSKSAFKRKLHHFISKLLFWMPVEKLNSIQQNAMSKYKNENSEYYCSMASGYGYKKQTISKTVYGKPTLYLFEDRHYYGPEKYDEYLTHIYGDYNVLPPEHKRQANLDLFTAVEFE